MNGPLGIPGDGPIQRFEAREALGFMPYGWLAGLTLANDTTDATNDISIAAGVARSGGRLVNGAISTAPRDQIDLELPVAVIKQLDVAWAPENYDAGIEPAQASGDRSGGRSSSSLANGTWHVFLIGGGGQPVDILIHDSVTASSILTEMQKLGGYTAYRRIGSILRESGALIAFVQHGAYFQRATRAADVSANNPGTSAVSRTLSVPTGIRVMADVLFEASNAANGGVVYGLLSDLDATDSSPAAGLCQVGGIQTATGRTDTGVAPVQIRTNTSGQLRSRVSFSDTNVTVRIGTRGWFDLRD